MGLFVLASRDVHFYFVFAGGGKINTETVTDINALFHLILIILQIKNLLFSTDEQTERQRQRET